MESRVNKYNESESMSRVSKNSELYKEINNEDIDNFSLRSNATVIGNQEQEIDIEKIKKILDKRYNDAPKRKSIRIEPAENESSLVDEPTKEYDLNVVLEKAKDEKEETYEEMRAKKLRNTQFDILNNLNLDVQEESVSEDEEEKPKSSAEDLMELINTITLNEAKKKEESEEMDLLDDLVGSDNTQVYESMSTEVTKIIEIKEKEDNNTENKELEEKVEENTTEIKEEKPGLDNSFYTKNIFKKKDFENEEDFVENEKLGIWVKVLIVIVVICFLIGLFLFLKSFLKF